MKAIVTGANGTVGQYLVEGLGKQGHEVVVWDRAEVPIDDYQAMEEWVAAQNADIIYHLAMASQPTGRENEGWLVNYHWPSELAWITRTLGMRFVFTSSVMVWTDGAVGPFTPETPPDAKEGYGKEKHRAEERVFSQNPLATVVRLGWQIGVGPGSNNMVDFLEREDRENGAIRASQRWVPSCSLLPDTAEALVKLGSIDCGLYLLNQNDRWNFYEVVEALKHKLNTDWTVEMTDDFTFDQRMLDERLRLPGLEKRLETLLQ